MNLQLLLDGSASSALMGVLMLVGLVRTAGNRVTRLSALIVAATLVGYKAADRIHPIMSDYTMHWCASFTVLLATASLARFGRVGARLAQSRAMHFALGGLAGVVLLAVVGDGLYELVDEVWIPEPQDFRYTIETLAHTPGAELLVSHESVAVVVTQACMLEFHRPACPFRLIVMDNPSPTDSWAFGGYPGPIVPVSEVRKVLAGARTIYVFSRYVYTPLTQLGMGARRYPVVAWDDGELIGPIRAREFAALH